MKITYLVLFLLFSATSYANIETGGARDVIVTASGLNIRDASGNILCSVRRDSGLVAVGRRSDSETIKVNVDSDRCPGIKEGFVAAKYTRPKTGSRSNEFTVDVPGLSFRSEPNFDGTWRCSLPKDTKVLGTDKEIVTGEDVTWVNVKIKDPVPGCPSEGYVANSYISATGIFNDLPVVQVTGEDCADCQTHNGEIAATGVLDNVSSALSSQLHPDQRGSPYLDEIRKMIKKPKYKPRGIPSYRGLAQFPLIGRRGNIGPCGSHHYNPDNPIGSDAYTNPLTACVLISVLQDWKKKYCPDGDDGCTVSWGDISNRTRPEFSGHRTHTNGQCLDLRPMRKGGFEDAALTYKSSDYDQKKMKQFVNFLRAKGGSSIIFNDTSLGTRALKGHHNHIHVCFKDSEKTRDVCNNLQVDSNVCPELQ